MLSYFAIILCRQNMNVIATHSKSTCSSVRNSIAEFQSFGICLNFKER
jgi:hypothetical protein